MRTLSVTLSDSMWAETFPGTVSAIKNQGGSQPEHRGQHLRPPNPNTNSSSSNSARSNLGRRRSSGPSDSEIAEDDKYDGNDSKGDKDDEDHSNLFRDWLSPSSPGDHELDEPFVDILYE